MIFLNVYFAGEFSWYFHFFQALTFSHIFLYHHSIPIRSRFTVSHKHSFFVISALFHIQSCAWAMPLSEMHLDEPNWTFSSAVRIKSPKSKQEKSRNEDNRHVSKRVLIPTFPIKNHPKTRAKWWMLENCGGFSTFCLLACFLRKLISFFLSVSRSLCVDIKISSNIMRRKLHMTRHFHFSHSIFQLQFKIEMYNVKRMLPKQRQGESKKRKESEYCIEGELVVWFLTVVNALENILSITVENAQWYWSHEWRTRCTVAFAFAFAKIL